MENVIIVVILIAAVGGASYYIWKSKKRGQACIGCPHGGKCCKCKHNVVPFHNSNTPPFQKFGYAEIKQMRDPRTP